MGFSHTTSHKAILALGILILRSNTDLKIDAYFYKLVYESSGAILSDKIDSLEQLSGSLLEKVLTLQITVHRKDKIK